MLGNANGCVYCNCRPCCYVSVGIYQPTSPCFNTVTLELDLGCAVSAYALFKNNIYSKAKATYVSPDLLRTFPPPQAMTMYCFPFTL